jgi:hypothetical protein
MPEGGGHLLPFSHRKGLHRTTDFQEAEPTRIGSHPAAADMPIGDYQMWLLKRLDSLARR